MSKGSICTLFPQSLLKLTWEKWAFGLKLIMNMGNCVHKCKVMVLKDDLSLRWQNCSEELLSSLLTNFNCLATVCSVIYTGGEKKKRQKIIHMVFGTKNSSFHLFLSKALFHITCETVDHGCANSWTETVADSYLYQQKRKAVTIFSLILVT